MRDAQPAAFGHDRTHGLGAGLVPLNTSKAASLRPAAVTVHDDGKMSGKMGKLLFHSA